MCIFMNILTSVTCMHAIPNTCYKQGFVCDNRGSIYPLQKKKSHLHHQLPAIHVSFVRMDYYDNVQ